MKVGYGMGDVDDTVEKPIDYKERAEKLQQKNRLLTSLIAELTISVERAVALNNLNDIKCFILSDHYIEMVKKIRSMGLW